EPQSGAVGVGDRCPPRQRSGRPHGACHRGPDQHLGAVGQGSVAQPLPDQMCDGDDRQRELPGPGGHPHTCITYVVESRVGTKPSLSNSPKESSRLGWSRPSAAYSIPDSAYAAMTWVSSAVAIPLPRQGARTPSMSTYPSLQPRVGQSCSYLLDNTYPATWARSLV